MKVGVIGLGNMGLGIATNLLNKGYEVIGYDINPVRGEMLEAAGGRAAANAAEVGKEAKTVILMVFSPENLTDVLFGANGLAETLGKGGTVVITATVGPEVVKEAEPKLTQAGISILDAPLMAGVDSARAGDMHMLIGADKETVERNRELLDAMGEEFYYVGDKPGMGQAGKLCLQTLFSLEFESAFELITLAKKLDLNMEEMRRLYENSDSASGLFFETEQNILDRVFTGTFNPLSILDKDIHLSLDLSRKVGIDLPAVAGTAENFRAAMGKFPTEDIWAAVKTIEEK